MRERAGAQPEAANAGFVEQRVACYFHGADALAALQARRSTVMTRRMAHV